MSRIDYIQILEGLDGFAADMVTADRLDLGAPVELEQLYANFHGVALEGRIARHIKSGLRSIGKELLASLCTFTGAKLQSKCNELADPDARAECIRLATQGLNIFCIEKNEREEVAKAEAGFTVDDGADGAGTVTWSAGAPTFRPAVVTRRPGTITATPKGASGAGATGGVSPVVAGGVALVAGYGVYRLLFR